MAVTKRDRRTAYDNIEIGSATGLENLAVATAPRTELWGNAMDIAIGSIYGKENVIVSGTALILGENVV